MSNTPRVVCVYHHRGDFGPLERIIKWFSRVNAKLHLVVRLDEDDPYLPVVQDSIDGMEIQIENDFAFNVLIGPSGRDAVELSGELWGDDPSAAKELSMVTDSPTSLACFVLAYTGLK